MSVDILYHDRVRVLSFICDIYRLSAYHTFAASCRGNQVDHPEQWCFFPLFFQTIPRHKIEGQGKQTITGQNCNPLPKYLMVRGLAPSKVIIVHCRKIVVYERVGMNEFDRTGHW